MNDPYPLLAQFPHCDQSVLHAPGECEYCDHHPEWQQLREAWGIAYTGHRPSERQIACPSDFRRGLAGAHVWYGNVPRPKDEQGKISWGALFVAVVIVAIVALMVLLGVFDR